MKATNLLTEGILTYLAATISLEKLNVQGKMGMKYLDGE